MADGASPRGAERLSPRLLRVLHRYPPVTVSTAVVARDGAATLSAVTTVTGGVESL